MILDSQSSIYFEDWNLILCAGTFLKTLADVSFLTIDLWNCAEIILASHQTDISIRQLPFITSCEFVYRVSCKNLGSAELT